MPEETERQAPIGTIAYDNWRAFEAGDPQLAGYEQLLYSDAVLTGAVTEGL
jgi:hypothetical protein